MSLRRTVQRFAQWRQHGEVLVLATVYETMGSTYSKAGHRSLIAANGDYQGLVSGGCLEGDLGERANRIRETLKPASITYDLRDEADDLWGLGVGCNGLIRVFMQPLEPERDYAPFAAIAQRLMGTERAATATIIEPGDSALPPGGTLIRTVDSSEAWGLEAADPDRLAAGSGKPGADAERLAAGCDEVLRSGQARYVIDDAGTGVLYSALVPVPRLLVLGAGPDAVPLVRMAAEVGWLVTVADHRPAYIDKGGFEAAEQVRTIDPAALASELDLDAFDAVIVMSHHLDTDRTYLARLATAGAGYVGVLGPPARKARLLDELGAAGGALRPRLKGPVGIDIGADSPESIAVSILAELQALRSVAGAPDG